MSTDKLIEYGGKQYSLELEQGFGEFLEALVDDLVVRNPEFEDVINQRSDDPELVDALVGGFMAELRGIAEGNKHADLILKNASALLSEISDGFAQRIYQELTGEHRGIDYYRSLLSTQTGSGIATVVGTVFDLDFDLETKKQFMFEAMAINATEAQRIFVDFVGATFIARLPEQERSSILEEMEGNLMRYGEVSLDIFYAKNRIEAVYGEGKLKDILEEIARIKIEYNFYDLTKRFREEYGAEFLVKLLKKTALVGSERDYSLIRYFTDVDEDDVAILTTENAKDIVDFVLKNVAGETNLKLFSRQREALLIPELNDEDRAALILKYKDNPGFVANNLATLYSIFSSNLDLVGPETLAALVSITGIAQYKSALRELFTTVKIWDNPDLIADGFTEKLLEELPSYKELGGISNEFIRMMPRKVRLRIDELADQYPDLVSADYLYDQVVNNGKTIDYIVATQAGEDELAYLGVLIFESDELEVEQKFIMCTELFEDRQRVRSLHTKFQALRWSYGIWKDNLALFELYSNDIGVDSDKIAEILAKNKHEYIYAADPIDMLREFHGSLVDLGVDNFEKLASLKYEHESFSKYLLDKSRLGLAKQYLNTVGVIDKVFFHHYLDVGLDEGMDGAQAFLESVIAEGEGLIGSKADVKVREHQYYNFMVKYLFPEGNYSNHKRNLACGDKLEHLDDYTYDKAGYAGELTGLLGYELVDDAEEDLGALASYSRRMEKLNGLIQGRVHRAEDLESEYENRVWDFFNQYGAEPFREIGGLRVRHQLLALILTDLLARAAGDTNAPNSRVSDLLVEYKYIYEEDLDVYVRQSAADAKQYEDDVSQHYVLWRELSVIYGENLKHVVNNGIFAELDEDDQIVRQMLDEFEANLSVPDDGFSLTDKQNSRLVSTFENERIPVDRKMSVLNKQLVTIFSSNLTFESDEAKEQFVGKITAAIEPLAGTFTDLDNAYQLFETVVLPKLVRLRSAHLYELNTQLEHYILHDINLINRELAKYIEVVEVERKETEIGGKKVKSVKKSVRKRKVRSYITKTREAANARMGAYLCIAGDTGMWSNPNYFELVMQDEETKKCIGTTMLLNIEATDGKKYLWMGPNPFESFLTKVSSEKTYKYIYDIVTQFAAENGYDGVVIPKDDSQILGACTNRGGDFPAIIKESRLRAEDGSLKVVDFGAKHQLGGNYGYENGALIWEKAV